MRGLPSTHFTVLLDPVRRLAAATVVDVDGALLRDVPRDDDWHLDPRVPADEQTGPELYARNDLDRGHLVRRRDPVWGDAATAARANTETFAYPNAAPQAARFNQSLELWNGLEDHVLGHAETVGLRLVVLTGPVLAPDDPVYRGVGIPRLFWKVVAWATGAQPALAATAFVLDQSPQLGELELQVADARALAAGDVPPLGPFRTFQVPVAEVASLTGLDLGPLVGADVLAPAVPAAAPTELHDLADVQLR
ncbi:DNA/RNA non-specific endonuclease [Cellulosimicrobium terreum]|nr:DNA/RNA non-specific endonuclease [Cellulosimicrobium terreum]